MTPSEVLARSIADRRMLEVAGDRPAQPGTRGAGCGSSSTRRGPGPRSTHGGLRAYLAWAAHQGQETAPGRRGGAAGDRRRRGAGHDDPRRQGPGVPDRDLSGMTSQGGARPRRSAALAADGGYAVRLTKGIQTDDFDAVQPVDEQMDELEKRRLLYVAATARATTSSCRCTGRPGREPRRLLG